MTLKPSSNPPTCFPSNLLSGRSHYDTQPWWVVRTKSRQEKALAWNLYSLGIGYFLPLIHRPQKSKTRVRISVLPLFSGYLFFKGDHLQRQQVLQTNRVAQVIEVVDQTKLTHELQGIHSLLKEKKEVELSEFLPKGQKVQITHGPFKGLSGRVKRHKNRSYLYLSVECIGQAVRVEIAADNVIPVSRKP